MALQPVLRNLQQSKGAMQPGAPEDPVQHDPWPCRQTHQCCLCRRKSKLATLPDLL